MTGWASASIAKRLFNVPRFITLCASSSTSLMSLSFWRVCNTINSRGKGYSAEGNVMPRFTLFLLGPPRLEWDGAPLEFGNRKAVALLAYLAVMRQTHSRDTLATLFWPESDQGRARAALRSTLWALNKTLGPGQLEIDTETLALAETADLWVDVEKFLGYLAAGQGHNHAKTEVCPACVPLLAEAIKLYQNDFLAGFSLRDSPEFDDWQFFQSEHLRRELGQALERLVQGQIAEGEFQA